MASRFRREMVGQSILRVVGLSVLIPLACASMSGAQDPNLEGLSQQEMQQVLVDGMRHGLSKIADVSSSFEEVFWTERHMFTNREETLERSFKFVYKGELHSFERTELALNGSGERYEGEVHRIEKFDGKVQYSLDDDYPDVVGLENESRGHYAYSYPLAGYRIPPFRRIEDILEESESVVIETSEDELGAYWKVSARILDQDAELIVRPDLDFRFTMARFIGPEFDAVYENSFETDQASGLPYPTLQRFRLIDPDSGEVSVERLVTTTNWAYNQGVEDSFFSVDTTGYEIVDLRDGGLAATARMQLETMEENLGDILKSDTGDGSLLSEENTIDINVPEGPESFRQNRDSDAQAVGRHWSWMPIILALLGAVLLLVGAATMVGKRRQKNR